MGWKIPLTCLSAKAELPAEQVCTARFKRYSGQLRVGSGFWYSAEKAETQDPTPESTPETLIPVSGGGVLKASRGEGVWLILAWSP